MYSPLAHTPTSIRSSQAEWHRSARVRRERTPLAERRCEMIPPSPTCPPRRLFSCHRWRRRAVVRFGSIPLPVSDPATRQIVSGSRIARNATQSHADQECVRRRETRSHALLRRHQREDYMLQARFGFRPGHPQGPMQLGNVERRHT